jgi:hypothetical protein
VEKPTLKDLFKYSSRSSNDCQNLLPADVFAGMKLVGSGKGAIAIILKYLKEKGVIINKLDEVMVPDWLGYWVYNQIQPFAFPAKKFSPRTKILFVYHQYGFPQDMDKILEFAQDKKLVVIEDCAHALNSYYKGRPLGSLGDFAIYSFSKWFFCFALGGVKAKHEDFYNYADNLIKQTPAALTLIKDSVKFFHERGAFSRRQLGKKYLDYLLAMSYSLYGDALKPNRAATGLLAAKAAKEVDVRQKRYRYFLDKMNGLGICDHLETEGITPYVIPIICSETKNEKILQALKAKNVITGLYQFDINRNLLSPNFAPCVWVPCHGGISDELFFDLTELIIKIIKK